MRKANPIRTWAIVALLGVAVIATMACEGDKSSYPTQPEARNFENPETSVVAADFTATVFAGQLTVLFTDTSTGNVTRWKWSFGDGKTSTERDPSHAYKTFGAYVVELTVSNSISSDTVTKFIEVPPVDDTVDDAAPEGEG